jgi:hypothetical protein
MATVTKTWTFTSDAEGLADEALEGALTFAHNAGEASVQFTTSKKNDSQTEGGLNPSTGETWVDWGVPTGSTITDIQITGWQERTDQNTKLDSHDITVDVVDSANSPVSVSPVIGPNLLLDTTISASFNDQGPETQRAVTAGNQASSTDVRLRLRYRVRKY